MPDGDDDSPRPNRIFAVSLPQSPLTPFQQQRVVDVWAKAAHLSWIAIALS